MALEANNVRRGRFEGGQRAAIIDNQLQDRLAVYVGVFGFGDSDGQAGCHQAKGRECGGFQHFSGSTSVVREGITQSCRVMLFYNIAKMLEWPQNIKVNSSA